MKILYVAPDVTIRGPYGSSTQVLAVCEKLSQLGHIIHVIARKNRGQPSFEKIDGFTVHRIARGTLFPVGSRELGYRTKRKTIIERLYRVYLKTIYSIVVGVYAAILVKKYGIDLIFERGSALSTGALAGIITKKPVVLQIIDQNYDLRSLKVAKRVVLYTPAVLRRSISAEKIKIVSGAADSEMFRPDIDGSTIRDIYSLGKSPVVLYVGNFAPWQGVQDLIIAGNKVLARRPDVKFLLVGPHFSVTSEQVKKLGVENAFIFTGSISHDAIPKFIAACDVAVAPYNSELDERFKGKPFPFSPLKIFEYMACGKPVITTNLETIQKIIRHTKDGILIPPGDTDALADWIIKLIEDKKYAKDLGVNAREVVEKKYTWDNFTRSVDELFKQVLSN